MAAGREMLLARGGSRLVTDLLQERNAMARVLGGPAPGGEGRTWAAIHGSGSVH